MIQQGSAVGGFADDYERIEMHYANGWKAMAHLVETEQAYERVVYLTDMQLWDTTCLISAVSQSTFDVVESVGNE